MLTTHYMDEAEQLCDRLVIMDDGRIVAEGSPRQLIDRHCTREVVELRFAASSRTRRWAARRTRRPRRAAGRPCCCGLQGDEALVITGNGIRPDSVLVRRGTLEDVFLTLTGRTLDE